MISKEKKAEIIAAYVMTGTIIFPGSDFVKVFSHIPEKPSQTLSNLWIKLS